MGGFVSPATGASGSFAQLDAATGTWLSLQTIWPARVRSMVVDEQERLHLAGYFESPTAQFGPVTLAQAGAGNSTGFVARTGAGVLAAAKGRLLEPGLQLWPNPVAGGPVHIQGPLPGQLVHVLDVLGRAVCAGRMPASGPLQLALPAQLPAGLYVVRGGGQARRLVVE